MKEKIKLNDRARQILKNVGESLQKAIESFTDVGQAIAAENDDIMEDMTDACSEAVKSGDIIISLTNLNEDSLFIDKPALVQVSRILLGSITRSLLLADVVAVKKLVKSAQKVNVFKESSGIEFGKHRNKRRSETEKFLKHCFCNVEII